LLAVIVVFWVSSILRNSSIDTFEKITPSGNELVNSGLLGNLFKEGLSLITYFGHSSASSMEYNLDDPSIYTNDGKYPLFIANGCNAGNIFAFDTLRITGARRSITENYVLTPNKGSIGFLASTHLGIVNYLNTYTTDFYKKISKITTNPSKIKKQLKFQSDKNLTTRSQKAEAVVQH
jgi:hypothetical protein